MKTFLLLLVSVFALSWFVSDAAAQCCTAGNPVNTNCALVDDGKGTLTVSGSYMYSLSDTYFKGTTPLDKKYMNSRFDYSAFAVSYGLSGKLRLLADVGFYFDKSQTFLSSDYTRYAEGISDATLGINFATYASEDNSFGINQTVKVTIPVGDFSQQYEGIILPIDFQPSSGNYRYNIGVNFSKNFAGSDFSLLSFNSVEFSQAIETRNTYHKYGNLYNASLMGLYRVFPSLLCLLQLRWEIRDRALNGTIGGGQNQYAFINASGGVIAYVSPQVAFTLMNDWTLSLQYNFPFYKNVYGEEQLTNRHSLSVNFSRSFHFGGDEEVSEFTKTDETFTTVDLRVSGNCGMCKNRIETTAVAIENVRKAEWDSETELLTVSYHKVKPDIDGIEKALAAAGHDTDNHKAPDTVYEKLPACCLYRK